jgi:rhamnulokinase
MTTFHLAFDLGAESGRLILGALGNGKLALEETHRFPNVPLQDQESLSWDLLKIFEELRAGLNRISSPASSISCDSWGLDYALFDSTGALMPPAFHYRDMRCHRGVDRVHSVLDRQTIFAETGIQFMPFNTIYQLAAEDPARLQQAALLLNIGDAINYVLCDVAKAEASLASTTQLYNPVTQDWSPLLLEKLQIPARLFPAVVPSGTRLGKIKPELASRFTGEMEVVASCSHDTGAAVAAVPGTGDDWAYLSSGTWSLMGVELPAPILSGRCRQLNFTNEIGFGGTVRLLTNIVGLWIVQECRRYWTAQGTDYSYAELTTLAAEAAPFVSLINPGDPRFATPGEMPGKMAAYCHETGQPQPSSPGAFIRCALESLALLYRKTLLDLEELTGRKLRRLHIVGGGSKNALLNQFTANALEIPVIAGPVEATAAGNILVQTLALGHVASLDQAREIVRLSFELREFCPQESWAPAISRFDALCRN